MWPWEWKILSRLLKELYCINGLSLVFLVVWVLWSNDIWQKRLFQIQPQDFSNMTVKLIYMADNHAFWDNAPAVCQKMTISLNYCQYNNLFIPIANCFPHMPLPPQGLKYKTIQQSPTFISLVQFFHTTKSEQRILLRTFSHWHFLELHWNTRWAYLREMIYIVSGHIYLSSGLHCC